MIKKLINNKDVTAEKPSSFRSKREQAAKQHMKKVVVYIALGLSVLGIVTTAVYTIVRQSDLSDTKKVKSEKLSVEESSNIKAILDGSVDPSSEESEASEDVVEESTVASLSEKTISQEDMDKEIKKRVDEAVDAVDKATRTQVEELSKVNGTLTSDNASLKAANEKLKSDYQVSQLELQSLKQENARLQSELEKLTGLGSVSLPE